MRLRRQEGMENKNFKAVYPLSEGAKETYGTAYYCKALCRIYPEGPSNLQVTSTRTRTKYVYLWKASQVLYRHGNFLILN
jgi:hypothetical protein